jgi:hypothetical protein
MVPAWVDDLPIAPEDLPPTQGGDELPIFDGAAQDPSSTILLAVPIAPSGRFANGRLNTGNFARTGNQNSLRRGVAQYIRHGYGGSSTFTRRMSGTARTAARLEGVLQRGTLPDGTRLQDAVLASGGDVGIVLDAVVNAVRDTDGSQDAEASRISVRDALSDLLGRFPDADLSALTDAQRSFVIERFAALDVYARFVLDMQATVMAKAGDPATALTRLRQIKSYISETVGAGFRRARAVGVPTSRTTAALTRAALTEACRVFEEYL